MKRALAILLLVVASPAFAQANGWKELQNGWGEIQTALVSYATMPAPSGCASGYVPVFLGSPLKMECAYGVTATPGTPAGPWEMGPDLVTNGDFAEGTDGWDFDEGTWVWSDGGVTPSATPGWKGLSAANTIPTVPMGTYRMTVVISGRTTGTIEIAAYGESTFLSFAGGVEATTTADAVAYTLDADDVAVQISSFDGFDGRIESISIRAVTRTPEVGAELTVSGAINTSALRLTRTPLPPCDESMRGRIASSNADDAVDSVKACLHAYGNYRWVGVTYGAEWDLVPEGRVLTATAAGDIAATKWIVPPLTGASLRSADGAPIDIRPLPAMPAPGYGRPGGTTTIAGGLANDGSGGGETPTAGRGGDLELFGGAAAGQYEGAADGGDVHLKPGEKTGDGAPGNILLDGRIVIPEIPVCADNTDAKNNFGLAVGRLYRLSTGQLMIVY